MATDIDQGYRGWPHEELSDQDDSQQHSVSEMLDHGSISFGRFALDSLAWEKRSVFTYNKCQEELEKFKAPGLVAQKKAYFEEYYKRIRAMKSLQENQQTELTLDYGGDGSISSQTGEEDETAAQLESHENEAAETGDATSDKDANEMRLEEKSFCGKVSEIQVLGAETKSSYCDPTGELLEMTEQETNSNDNYKMQYLVLDSSVQERSLGNKEEIVHHDLNRIDDTVAPRKCDSLELNVELEVATPYIEVPDVGSDVSGQGTAESNIASKISSVRSSHYLNSKMGDPEHKLSYKSAPDKAKVSVKKQEGRLPFLKIKEPAASAKRALKLESKTKSPMVKPLQTKSTLVKSLQRPTKISPQESSTKIEKCTSSSKHASDKISSNKKSTLVSSHRAPTAARSNVTIPRPFSLATEKRATSSSGIRQGALRLGSRGRDILASSLEHVEGSTSMQYSSKKQATSHVLQSRELENKRVSEEISRRSAVLNVRRISLSGIGAFVLEPPEARSNNLSAKNKANSTGETESRSTNVAIKVKHKELKEDTRSRGSCGDGTKSVARPLSANIRTGSKKNNLVKTDNPSLKGTNQWAGGNLSLDGKKPRKEMPRWR